MNPEKQNHFCEEDCIIDEDELSPYEVMLLYGYRPVQLWGAIKTGRR